MSYVIFFTKQAHEDIDFFKKSGNKAVLKKLQILLEELMEHPEVGTGHPEQLRFQFTGLWSRKITGKHRLVYRIEKEKVIVEFISAKDHYSDK
jgi:toxin YoeB